MKEAANKNGGDLEFTDTVVTINRVTKVVKGGKNFSFSAMVVVGDGKGSVGYGQGKALEVPAAIKKAVQAAKKAMIKIPILDGTIPHEVTERYRAGKVMLKPAKEGTGVIAGGAVRAVVEAAGIRDAQLIIAEGLDEKILKFKAIEAFKELSKSPNAKLTTNSSLQIAVGIVWSTISK